LVGSCSFYFESQNLIVFCFFVAALQATVVFVMGWATYTEFAAPLHGRENFILTSRSKPLRTGFRPIGSLDALVTDHPGQDIWVIGGATVYAETIGEAGELLLTQVVGDFDCTKFFPPYEADFSSGDAGRRPTGRRHHVSIRRRLPRNRRTLAEGGELSHRRPSLWMVLALGTWEFRPPLPATATARLVNPDARLPRSGRGVLGRTRNP
jgi:dihydrofolate reductase